MYKKTVKSRHLISRTGSYSTHPHRNGRVDILPPSAKLATYDDLDVRHEKILSKLSSASEDLRHVTLLKAQFPLAGLYRQWSVDQQASIDRFGLSAKKCQRILDHEAIERGIRDRIRGLKTELYLLGVIDSVEDYKSIAFGELFVRVAEALLDDDAFRLLENLTREKYAKRLRLATPERFDPRKHVFKYDEPNDVSDNSSTHVTELLESNAQGEAP